MIGQIEICPNCGEPTTGGLFHSESEVKHCGCYWESEPEEVLIHFTEDIERQPTVSKGRSEMSEPKCHCGSKCILSGTVKEPCWGEVGVSEEYPGSYIHFCKGHEDAAFGDGPYKPESNLIPESSPSLHPSEDS